MSQLTTIFDIEDPDAKKQALREAQANVAASRLVPHGKVAKWLDDLAAGSFRASPERPFFQMAFFQPTRLYDWLLLGFGVMGNGLR